MHIHLKSVSLAIAKRCCVAQIALFVPILHLQSQAYAQTQISPAANPSPSTQQLLATAKQHYRRAEFKQAIALYQQALTQAQQAGDSEALLRSRSVSQRSADRASQIEALLQLGDIDLWVSNIPQAEAKFQQALKLSREVKDRTHEGFSLALLSTVYRNRQEYIKATDLLKESLAIAQQTKDQKLETRSRFFTGTVLYLQKQYPQALETLQQALKLAQADDNQDEMAHIYDYMASTYRELKDFKQAEATIQQQQKLSRDTGYRLAEYDGLNTIAQLKLQQKQSDLVLQTYQKQLVIAQSADNPWFQKATLVNLGFVYVNQNQLPQGLEYLQKALAVAQTIDDDSVAGIQNRIGIAYYKAKQYPQALESYQQAIVLYQKTGNQTDLAQVWLNVGENYNNQEHYSQAREAYQQALTLYQQLNNLSGQAKTFRSIGYSYLTESQTVIDQNNYAQASKLVEQALALFQQSLEVARIIPDKQLEADATSAISLAYDRQGFVAQAEGNDAKALPIYAQALKTAEAALALNQQLQNQEGIKLSRSQIASVYFSLINGYNSTKQFDLALETVRKAEQLEGLTDKERHGILFFKFAVYGNLVNVYDNLQQYVKKLEILQKGIELAKQLKDPKAEVRYLVMTGQIYYSWGRYAEALDVYQQAISRAREVKEQQYEVIALVNVGIIYDAQANYPEALKIYEQALQRSRASNQPYYLQLTSLNNMVNVYSVQGQYAQALSIHQQVLATHQKFSEFFSKGVTPDTIRAVCTNNENFRESSDTSSKTGSLSEICDNPTQLPTGSRLNGFKNMMQTMVELAQSGIGTSYNNIAQLYADQGNYPKALEFQQKALPIFREQKNQTKEALTLNNISKVYMGQGNYTKALELTQQALNIAIAQNNPASEITYQLNLGVIYSSWGKYPEALAAYQRSLTLATQLGQPSSKALVLLRSATVYSNQGQYAKALTNLQEAREIWQKVGEPANESRAINAIAAVYQQLGQYPQAIATYQQALAITQKINARPLAVVTLSGLANTYQEQGQTEQALKTHQQALNLSREMGDRTYESLSLSGIGKIYLKQSQPQQALTVLQQALTIQQQIGTRPDTANTLSAIGQAQTQLNDATKAQASLQQAIALARTTENLPTEAQALSNLAQLFSKNQPELAIAFYKQSVNTYESIRTGIRTLPKEQQDSYTQTIARTYRQLADVLITQGRLAEAQQVLELLKIQELNDYTKGTRSAANLSDVQLNEIEEKIIKEHQTLITFTQKLNECNKCEQQAQLIQQAEAVQEQYNRSLQALSEQSRKNRANDESFLDPNSRFGALAKDILQKQADTVILYPLVLDNKIWILMASGGGLLTRYEVTVDQKELNTTVFELRKLLQNPYSDLTELQATSQKLYGWLIKPLEAELKTKIQGKGIKHLIFALDRVTRYIPMSVLFDGKQYLIENYTINTIIGAGQTNFSDSLPAISAQTTVLGVGLSEAKPNFGALPNVPLELGAIVKGQGGGIYPGETFLNQAFTFDTLQNNLKGKQILHIATHGEFVPGRANNSYLLLGTGDKLTIPDIERLRFLGDVNMVVLSACQTALGGSSDGVEISGVSDFFFRKGVRTVLASLWNVNDASTMLMMQQFYKHLWEGKPKDQALQEIQLSMIRGEKTAKDLTDRSIVVVEGLSPTRT
jgi:tetratricopeptide (TPR) repeat protein